MKVVYGTPWIEVEFGSRPEGWAIYADREACITDTKRRSAEGPYHGGYMGPERPLVVYEIPFDCLETDAKKAIKKSGLAWSTNFWQPKFRDKGTPI